MNVHGDFLTKSLKKPITQVIVKHDYGQYVTQQEIHEKNELIAPNALTNFSIFRK